MQGELVRLRDFLSRHAESVELHPTKQYKQVTVKLWGQGVCLRNVVSGTEIGADRRFAVRPGQFILSRIDARHGAFGLIPPELDDAVVSGDFPTFNVDDQIMLPEYFRWLTRSNAFLDLCKRSSKGTTNRVRLDEQAFLDFLVHVPSLNQQHNIVRVLRTLEEKIDALSVISNSIVESTEAICQWILFDGRQYPSRAMTEFMSLRDEPTQVELGRDYAFAGVYSFGRGVFRGLVKSGLDFSYERLTKVHAGDFIYPKLMAWEGALGVVPEELDGLFVSPEFPVFAVDTSIMLPSTLSFYFRRPSVWADLAALSSGTNARRRRLHPDRFLSYKMPVPPHDLQCLVEAITKRVSSVSELQSTIKNATDTLLPSLVEKVFERTFGGNVPRDLVCTTV